MTITSSSLFELAQLAEVAYADFWDASRGIVLTDPEAVKKRLVDLQPDRTYDFSSAQATEFLANWSVIAHQPNTTSGFSSTLFKSNDPAGSYVLALRGIEPGQADFSADGGIVVNGLAITQIVDMYNEWQRINTHDYDLKFAA